MTPRSPACFPVLWSVPCETSRVLLQMSDDGVRGWTWRPLLDLVPGPALNLAESNELLAGLLSLGPTRSERRTEREGAAQKLQHDPISC